MLMFQELSLRHAKFLHAGSLRKKALKGVTLGYKRFLPRTDDASSVTCKDASDVYTLGKVSDHK